MKKVIAVAAFAGAAWFVWPYITAYSLAKAIDSGDRVKLEQHVS